MLIKYRIEQAVYKFDKYRYYNKTDVYSWLSIINLLY